MLAMQSSPTRPPELIIGQLNVTSSDVGVVWKTIYQPTLPPSVQDPLEAVDVSIATFPERGRWVEAILVRPKSSTSFCFVSRLIMEYGQVRRVHWWCSRMVARIVGFQRHGVSRLRHLRSVGIQSVGSFGEPVAASLWCLAMVNYTGSTGFGQASIDALVGRIGTTDIEDVHVCIPCLGY
jgi:acylaminoacyl-peptidase